MAVRWANDYRTTIGPVLELECLNAHTRILGARPNSAVQLQQTYKMVAYTQPLITLLRNGPSVEECSISMDISNICICLAPHRVK